MAEKTFIPVSATGEGGIRFIRPSQLAKDGVTGLILEAVYKGSLTNQMDESKLDYKFEDDSGTTVVLNGAGNLGYQMQKVPLGSVVQIEYNGKSTIAKGPRAGKEAHNFLVKVEADL